MSVKSHRSIFLYGPEKTLAHNEYYLSGLSMNVFFARVINNLCKKVFSKIEQAIYCPPLDFWAVCIIFVIL